MAEQSQSSFAMNGAREAISRGLEHIEQQVNAIEGAVLENPGLAFDLARTLVESTCRTILTERSIEFSTDDDVPRLFRTVRASLPILPPQASRETDIRQSIDTTLNGLSTAIQGITQLRNQLGFASHGTDKARPLMESVHAILAAQAADAIVGFLYRIHTQDRHSPTSPESSNDRNSEFDRFIDESHDTVRIFESEFSPSEILFQMEPDSYRIGLAEFLDEANSSEEV